MFMPLKNTIRPKAARKEGNGKIEKRSKNLTRPGENLESVYSETRFIAYPDNYVPDRYFHFASQREDLTWMIQDEQLFFREIRTWLNLPMDKEAVQRQ